MTPINPPSPTKAEIAQALATIILSRCVHDLEPWLKFSEFRPALEKLIEEQLGESQREATHG